MKKKSFSFRNALACVIAFFGVVSCSNDKDILEITEKAPPMKSIEKVPCTRSIDEAKTIAANFLGQSTMGNVGRSNVKRAQAQPCVQVLLKDSLPDKVDVGNKYPGNLFPDTLMYAVSYVDGTVLIPADKDAPTVVGVLDTKPESLPALLKKNNGNNPLYEVLKMAFNPDMYRLLTDKDWMKAMMPSHDKDYPVYDGEHNDDYAKRDYYLAPKMPVAWSQGNPFNNQCPLIGGQHAVAGCVAIAVGQAMTLTGVPASLSHYRDEYLGIRNIVTANSYNSYPEYGKKVSKLIASIGPAVGMNYGLTSSGTSDLRGAVNLFLEMGMHVSQNKKVIKRVLQKHQKGFILVGSFPSNSNSGHCYLIDGYSYQVKKEDATALLHVNFGWGPECNGFFLVNLFAPHFDPDRTVDSNGDPLPTFPRNWHFYCIYD